MSEEIKPMRVVKVDYRCDVCNEGYMRPTGVTLMSYPATNPHRCENCDVLKAFMRIYPYIDYVEVVE